MFHDTMYHVVFTGGTIVEGDYVVFVRNDWKNGATGCEDIVEGSSKIVNSGLHNDFVYGVDADDSPYQTDAGGIVQSHDIDAAEAGDEVFADIQLLGVVDGRTDSDPFDDDDETGIVGNVRDDSTYTLCLADYSANGRGTPYTSSSLPTTDAEFTHYPQVLIHIQHQ